VTDADLEDPSMPRTDRAAYLMLIGMALSFGGTWVAADLAVQAVPPFAIAAIRFGLASVLLFAWTRLAARRLAPIRRTDLPMIAGLALTAVAGYNWLFLTGLTLAPASDGAIIVPGLAPVFTALLAGLVLGERLTGRVFLGLAIAAVGLVLVVAPAGVELDADRLLGDALFLAGAALWAVYNILSRTASRRFDAVSTTLYGIALGAVILVPAALLEGGAERVLEAPAEALAGIAYLAVFGTVAAFVLLNLGVARIGAARASAFALLVPVVGVLSSVWLLGDPIGPGTLVGGAIVLGGLWLVEHPGASSAPSISSPPPRTAHDEV
jgi:drug/metabolite transporter (DMT)-like permease